MHELAICDALIAKVEGLERPVGARVKRVEVRVGPLSGVDPALLAHAYPLSCAAGAAEGSVLDIVASGVRVRCRSCGAESAAKVNRLLCAACGDWRTDVTSGDELQLVAVEFESAPETVHV